MDVINSIKRLIFNKDDNEKNISKNNKEEKKVKEDDYHINYYKYLFKLNYKKKKSNEANNNNNITYISLKQKQLSPELKIKVNKCLKYDKPQLNKNQAKVDNNISFFYILKGAIFIIEDWWKQILIHKINNKNIIKRNIKSKNYKLFSKKNYKKSKNNSKSLNNINLINNNIKIKSINKNKEKISDIIIFNRNIDNNKNNMLINNKKKKNTVYKSVNINDIKVKNKINEIFDNQSQKDSYLEETVINSDSGFCEFTTDNKNKNNDSEIINKEKKKINKILEFDEEIRKRKIYSSDNLNTKKNTIKDNNDNLETKRENSIIYPMNEIEHLIIEDMCSDLDNLLKKNIEKEKKIIEKYNYIEKNKNFAKIKSNSNNNNNKEMEANKISIPWEDPNNNMTPFISIEQNNDLFNEIKSKIKVNLKNVNDEYESEEISMIQNKQLLRENPLNDSSIYLRNSDIKQNELIRNVNIHIIPTKIKKNNNINQYKSKMLNNSNNSNTILLEDEDYGFSELINISDSKNDGHMSSFFNSINKNRDTENERGKNDTKRKIKDYDKTNLKIFENVYKN
jgi:hypothetical protein